MRTVGNEGYAQDKQKVIRPPHEMGQHDNRQVLLGPQNHPSVHTQTASKNRRHAAVGSAAGTQHVRCAAPSSPQSTWPCARVPQPPQHSACPGSSRLTASPRVTSHHAMHQLTKKTSGPDQLLPNSSLATSAFPAVTTRQLPVLQHQTPAISPYCLRCCPAAPSCS